MEPVTMKTDNEPALVKVVENIGRLRAAKGGMGMIVENSPVYSSKSNGYIERAVQSVQGMVRTLRSAVEEKWGVKLETENAIWPWMVEYASLLLTRMEVSADGKTAYERSRGKVAKMPGLEFGEGVLWKRRREGGRGGRALTNSFPCLSRECLSNTMATPVALCVSVLQQKGYKGSRSMGVGLCALF